MPVGAPLHRLQATGPATGYARFVGRVGALAVALGVGVAVATSYGLPLAHADDTTEQAPTDPTAEPQGNGDSPAGAGGDAVDKPDPVVTVNGKPVDGDANHDAGTRAATKVPTMNFDAQGSHQEQHADTKQARGEEKGKAADQPVEQNQGSVVVTDTGDASLPVAPTPESPADPPAPPVVVVVDQDPPVDPQPSVDPQPQDVPKPKPSDDVKHTVAPLDPPKTIEAADELDNDEGSGVDALGVIDGDPGLGVDSGADTGVGTSLRMSTFDAPMNQESQRLSTLIAPAPNVIEPEQPDLIAGLVALPGVVVRLAATVLAAALAPFAQITGPIAPPQPPTLWAVLAWVRREFERTLCNQTPHAVDDTSTSTDEGESVDIAALVNDTDADEDPLTVTDFTQPAHGTVSYDAVTKTFTYTPDDDFTGADTFEYAVSDEGGLPHWHGVLGGLFDVGHQDSATVTVTVVASNEAPTAIDDVADTDEDTAVTGNVLANDVDPDGDLLTVVTPGRILGAYGVFTLKADGSYTYTPGGHLTLDDPGQVTQGTVDYDWTGYGDAGERHYVATTFTAGTSGSYDFGQTGGPTDTVIAVYDGEFDPTAPDANLVDFDDDSGPGLKPLLTVDLVEGQRYTVVVSNYEVGEPLELPVDIHATPSGDPANALDDGDEVTDSVGYTMTDGSEIDTATLTVTITGVNDAPVAGDDVDFTDEDTPVEGNVLVNDVDPDDLLTVTTTGSTIGAYGVFSVKADGSYTYSPGGRLVLDDPELTSQGTVDHDWTGLGDPGERNYVATTFTAGADGTYEFGQTGGATDTLIAIYEGDFDPSAPTTNLVDYDDDSGPGLKPRLTVDLVEGQQYTIVVSTYELGESVDLDLYATLAGDPANALDDGDQVTDTFGYTVTDGDESSTASVSIDVFGLNDAPDAVDDVDITDADTPVAGSVVTNDVDPDDPLTVTTPGRILGTYGVFSLQADGSYTYTPGGALTLDDPTQVALGTVDHDWTGIGDPGERNYVATTFTAGVSGSYEFGQTGGATDTLIAIYQGDFDPNAPTTNFVDYDDDSGPGLKPKLTVDLVEGQRYTIVVSTYEVDEPLDLPLGIYATATGDPANALGDGEEGIDEFGYTVTDGDESSSATITVVVVGTNVAPVITAVDVVVDPATGIADGTVTATDENGDALTFSAPAMTPHGSVSIDPDTGAFVYTPNETLAIVPGSDFESGDLTGWQTGGQPGNAADVISRESTGSTVTTGGLVFEPTAVDDPNAPPDLVLSDWVFTPAGNHAAALAPNGSQTFAQAGTALGLTAAQQQEIATLSIDPQNPTGPQDSAWIAKVVHLEAGTVYTMSWNYVSTDYEPFNDGSITTLVYTGADPAPTVYVNGYQGNYAILGFTNEGTGDYSTKSFGSTGWQTSTYQVTETGDYRIGFAVFNLRDSFYDPVLLIDSQPGTTTRDGQPYSPVPPNSPTAPRTIDDTFTVTVDDGHGGTDEAEVTVQVTVVGVPLQV